MLVAGVGGGGVENTKHFMNVSLCGVSVLLFFEGGLLLLLLLLLYACLLLLQKLGGGGGGGMSGWAEHNTSDQGQFLYGGSRHCIGFTGPLWCHFQRAPLQSRAMRRPGVDTGNKTP